MLNTRTQGSAWSHFTAMIKVNRFWNCPTARSAKSMCAPLFYAPSGMYACQNFSFFTYRRCHRTQTHCNEFHEKSMSAQCRHDAAVHLAIWMLAILVFLCLFVFMLGVHTRQTDAWTNGQTGKTRNVAYHDGRITNMSCFLILQMFAAATKNIVKNWKIHKTRNKKSC